NRTTCRREFRMYRLWSSARRSDDEDLSGSCSPEVPFRRRSNPICHPRAIRRETRATAKFSQQPGLAPKGGDQIDASSFAVGTEWDLASVWREGRLAIVRLVVSDAARRSATDGAHPNVEACAAISIRGVSQQVAVFRHSWICVQAGIGRQPD